MAYYDENYRYRVAVAVDFTTLSGTGTNDVSFTVPRFWDQFWGTIQADGDDVRVCDSDGATLLDYQWSTFTYASRAGVIEVDNVPYTSLPAAGGTKVIWLYFGYDAATDGSSSFTASGALTGVIELLQADPGMLARVAVERAGSETNLVNLPITDEEDALRVYIDLDARLRRRCARHNSANLGEEIEQVTTIVVTDQDADVASSTDDANTRIVSCGQGRGSIISVQVDGSQLTDGSNYALKATVRTSEGQIIQPRVGLLCQNTRPRS